MARCSAGAAHRADRRGSRATRTDCNRSFMLARLSDITLADTARLSDITPTDTVLRAAS